MLHHFIRDHVHSSHACTRHCFSPSVRSHSRFVIVKTHLSSAKSAKLYNLVDQNSRGNRWPYYLVLPGVTSTSWDSIPINQHSTFGFLWVHWPIIIFLPTLPTLQLWGYTSVPHEIRENLPTKFLHGDKSHHARMQQCRAWRLTIENSAVASERLSELIIGSSSPKPYTNRLLGPNLVGVNSLELI